MSWFECTYNGDLYYRYGKLAATSSDHAYLVLTIRVLSLNLEDAVKASRAALETLVPVVQLKTFTLIKAEVK